MPPHLVSNMDDCWDQHKNEIRMLYYSDDRNTSTLKSIMAHMTERRNFIKSKSQYERQFKKWGFQKNNTGSEWKTVHRKIEKRQRQGKESVVYQSGRLIRMEKVNKAKRHNFRRTEELFKPEELPKTPEGFSVCTPMANNMPYIFINNLPSLRLLRHLQPTAFTSSDDMNTENYDLLNLVSLTRGSSSLNEIFRTPHAISLSSVALPLLHACSNNLLTDKQATAVMDMILESGNRGVFKALISQHTPATKAIARKLLPSAIASGDVSMVKLLLDTGISPDLPVDYGHRRPLLLAVMAGNYELVKMFLDLGARANSSPYETVSSLAVAAGAGRSDLVRLLLDSGANVHSTYAERAILQEAASSGSIDVLELLLDAGADINAQDSYSGYNTALHVAVRRKDMALVRLLLYRGARTDIVGTDSHVTALVEGVSTGDAALVQLLLSHGADANGAPQGYESPLCRAASIGRQDLVQLFLSLGADANRAPQGYESPLCSAASLGRQDLVNLLLAWGASDTLSAMDAASKIGHMEIVRICFEAGTLLNDVPIDAYERMAVRSGVRCGDYHFVQQFLNSRRHIDVDAPAIAGNAHWETSLQTAAKKGRLDIVELLIHFGANVNSHFACRTTAVLHAATGSENVHLVEYLLRCGACINAPTDNSWGNQSPLCLAARLANPEIVKLLLEWGADMVADGEDALLSTIDSLFWLSLNAERAIEVVRLLLQHRVNFTDPSADGDESCQKKVPFKYDHIEDILYHPELVRLLLQHRSLDASEALIVAIREHDLELVKLFLENGADVNTESQHGLFALAIVEDLEVLHCLLEHGANAREKARALQRASLHEDLEAAHLLIEFGADVNADPLDIRESYRRTALQAAAGTGNLELVQVLLEKGAEVERLSTSLHEQGTALQFAAIGGSIPIVNELIQKGANVNARPISIYGRTALEGAAEHGRLDMVQLLLNLEADTQGSRALQFARMEGHEGVVALLLENGFEEDFTMSD